MKAGDYVRFEGKLFKIIEIEDGVVDLDKSYFDDYGEKTHSINYDELNENCKASFEPIELVEVGDVVEIKEYCDDACMVFIETYHIQNETQLLNIKSDLEKNKNHILISITTKEQFESMKYKVGE